MVSYQLMVTGQHRRPKSRWLTCGLGLIAKIKDLKALYWTRPSSGSSLHCHHGLSVNIEYLFGAKGWYAKMQMDSGVVTLFSYRSVYNSEAWGFGCGSKVMIGIKCTIRRDNKDKMHLSGCIEQKKDVRWAGHSYT